MAARSKEQRQDECDMNNHPYRQYETTLAWKIIDQAVSAIVKNQDIKETTARVYIVGYLVKQLVEQGVITTTP